VKHGANHLARCARSGGRDRIFGAAARARDCIIDRPQQAVAPPSRQPTPHQSGPGLGLPPGFSGRRARTPHVRPLARRFGDGRTPSSRACRRFSDAAACIQRGLGSHGLVNALLLNQSSRQPAHRMRLRVYALPLLLVDAAVEVPRQERRKVFVFSRPGVDGCDSFASRIIRRPAVNVGRYGAISRAREHACLPFRRGTP